MLTSDELVRDIYEAGLTPELWPGVLSRIGALFDGEGATIIFYRDNAPAEFIFAPELEPAINVYLEEEWWRRDIHAQRVLESHMKSGDVIDDLAIVTPEEIETLPIYTDLFARVGLGWLMSHVMLPAEGVFVGLTVPRAKRKGPYRDSEIARLRRLGRHVEQALRVSLRTASLEAARRVLGAALDALDTGVYGLDAGRRLVMENETGRARFPDHFALVDGRVTTRDPEADPRFAAILAGAHRAEGLGWAPRTCLLDTPEGDRIVVSAAPLSDAGQARMGAPAAARTLVLTHRAASDRVVDPAVLRDVFGLSLGEARLASLIGAGQAVRQAAGQLGVTEGTARLVLKRVFRKLGVNRQAELVLRVSSLGRTGGA